MKFKKYLAMVLSLVIVANSAIPALAKEVLPKTLTLLHNPWKN